jgi:hypothetical protein
MLSMVLAIFRDLWSERNNDLEEEIGSHGDGMPQSATESANDFTNIDLTRPEWACQFGHQMSYFFLIFINLLITS